MRAALVLGAGVRVDGTASPTLRLRVMHAVGLWRDGAVEVICVAGGQGAHGQPEGQVGIALARDMGVPGTALIAETASRSTVENLAFAAPLLEGCEIVIVSNRWHLPRALMAARLLGMKARGDGPVGLMSRSRTARFVLREALAVPSTMVRALRR